MSTRSDGSQSHAVDTLNASRLVPLICAVPAGTITGAPGGAYSVPLIVTAAVAWRPPASQASPSTTSDGPLALTSPPACKSPSTWRFELVVRSVWLLAQSEPP